MRRKSDIPLEKKIFNLYVGDWDKLRNWHPRVGAARVIRELVRRHINEVEARQRKTTVDPELEV